MTFKHIDFASSEIMRSLERVAQQKGLIKPSVLTKTAKPRLDLTPTSNLMENIVKLCGVLRSQGLVKEANELEVNYFNYKQAQTLYETSKEKGEDVVQSAHPEGSHKLENVEGDEATFEDILDKHVKMMQVVEKKPTGKLSNAHILNEVKRALGQAISTDDQKKSTDKLALVVKYVSAIRARSSNLILSIDPYIKEINSLVAIPTIDNLKQLQSMLNMLHTRLDPTSWWHYATVGIGGLDEETWAIVKELLDAAKAAANEALEARINMKRQEADQLVNPPKETDVSTSPLSPLFDRIKSLSSKIKSWNAIRSVAQNATATQWIKDELATLSGIYQRYQSVSADQAANMVRPFKQELDSEVNDINDFERKWIAPKI